MTSSTDHLNADEAAMLLALVQAAESACRGEIPVGAVLRDRLGRVVAQCGNRSIVDHNPVGHAEINAMQWAGPRLGNYRLTDCMVSVTLEPCPMCAHALQEARIASSQYAARRAIDTVHHKATKPLSGPHQNTLERASTDLLRFFFEKRRET